MVIVTSSIDSPSSESLATTPLPATGIRRSIWKRPVAPRIAPLAAALQRQLDEDPEALAALRDSATFVLVQQKLDQALAEGGAVDAAVDHQVQRLLGLADGPRNIPATADTVYNQWSMVKPMTAVAVLQLHEQGLLDIDDPVADYLPFFEVQYPSENSETITIRHLIHHTSGLRDQWELFVMAGVEPVQAIKCCTYNASKILRRDKEFGSLQKGLSADILLVDS